MITGAPFSTLFKVESYLIRSDHNASTHPINYISDRYAIFGHGGGFFYCFASINITTSTTTEQQELPSRHETSRVNSDFSFSTISDIRYPITSSMPNMNSSIVSHNGTISSDNNSSNNNNMNNCNPFEPAMNVMNLSSPRNGTQSIIGSVNHDQNGIGIGVMSTGSNVDHAPHSRLQSQQQQQQAQFEFENGSTNEMRSNANKNVIDLFSFSSNGNSTNARIVIWEQLLSDTTEKAMFSNPLIVCGPVKMKEYNVLKTYSCDIVHSDKIKDDFEATIIEPSILLSDREPRIEYWKTDITFNTLFGNIANNVIENGTHVQSSRYCFETMKITPPFCTQTCFSCS